MSKKKQEATYVSKVRSNVKCGAFAELGPKTLIIGDNGTGKTAILNAIELALLGGASDVEGRDWTKGTTNSALVDALSDGVGLHSTVVLSTDETASYACAAGKRPDWQGPRVSVAMPFQELRAKLTASPDAARDFLMGAAIGAVADTDVQAQMSTAEWDLFLRTWQASGAQNIGSALPVIEKAQRSLSRKLTSEIKGAETVITSVGGSLGAPATEAQIESARTAANNAHGYLRQLETAAAQVVEPESAEIRDQRVAYTQHLAQTQAAISQLDALMVDARANVDLANHPRLQTYKAFVELHRDVNTEQCGLCNNHVPRAHLDTLSTQLGAMLADPATQWKDVSGQVFDLVALRKGHLDTRWQLMQWLDANPERHGTQGDKPTAVDLATARKDEASYRGAYEAYVAGNAAWERVKVARETIDRQRAEQVEADQLANACKRVSVVLVQQALVAFVDSVNAYMPGALQYGIEYDGKRFRHGLRDVDTNRLHSAMSGAQEAATLTAIGCALAGDQGGLTVLVPAERQWSPESLTDSLRAVEKAPCQVIVLSTVAPKGRTRKAWTTVTTPAEMRADDALPPEPDPTPTETLTTKTNGVFDHAVIN